MAPRASHDQLIHCANCGEDYSATYKKCPFCGTRNDPRKAAVIPPAPVPKDDDDFDDGYVFDGQDLFDDEPEDDYESAPRGGKRLAGNGRPIRPEAQVNWPRLITFLCSLIIIIAALVIVFTIVYPQLHKDKPSNPSTPPVSESDPVDPSSGPSQGVTVPTKELIGLTLNRADVTLMEVGDSIQLEAYFDPADWDGQLIWTSSNPEWAVVDETGLVTNVNNSGGLHMAVITASYGDISVEVQVYCRPDGGADPVQSDEPGISTPPTSAPPTGGNVTVGREGTIVGADSGLNVRSGPGTSYERIGSLENGNKVNVVEDAGNGWYKITYIGVGGTTATGYIMGDYVSTN